MAGPAAPKKFDRSLVEGPLAPAVWRLDWPTMLQNLVAGIKDMVEGFLDVPEETIQWMIRLGYIGLFFSVLFLVGGLFLLIKKDFSIQLAYTVLGANIAFSIFKWIMLSGKGGSMLAISNSVGAAFSIIISIIVGIIIVSCDKSHYEESYID